MRVFRYAFRPRRPSNLESSTFAEIAVQCWTTRLMTVESVIKKKIKINQFMLFLKKLIVKRNSLSIGLRDVR